MSSERDRAAGPDMNRFGYALVVALLVAGVAYVFWPRALERETIPLRQGPAPSAFIVRSPGLEQRVDGATVTLVITGGAELARPADAQRVSGLWEWLAALSAPSDKVVAAAEADLGAYGIDGSRAIEGGQGAGAVRLRWGQSGGLGYIWDGQRVFCMPAATCERLDATSRRLDEQALLLGADSIDRLTAGEVVLERGPTGSWVDRARADRPGLNVRVSHVLSLVSGLKLDSLAPGTSAPRAAVVSLTVRTAKPVAEHRIDIAADGEVRVDALPPQHLGSGVAGWTAAVGDLSRDVLLDLDPIALPANLTRFAVELGGHPWFAVDRRQASYRPGETQWDVSWAGGREPASEGAVMTAASELCEVAVEHAQPGPDPGPASPLARHFRLINQNGGQTDLTIDGERAWTSAHHGRLARPTALAALQPAALLDLALIGLPTERAAKIQVRQLDADPPRAEVVARAENGAWSRTYPKPAPGSAAPPPVDAVAIGRLARAFCSARARSARLLDDEDRAALEHPALAVDLRLAPRSAGAPSMEIADERDTVPQDRGFACYRDAKGEWRAIDVEGGVSYVIDEDLVELARRPFDVDVAFPLVPSLVARVEITRGGERYALARAGAGWTAQPLATQADGAAAPARPADELEARRLLRALGELRVLARDPKGAPLLPARAAASVVCVMPGAGGEERLTLALAEPRDGAAEASVDSTSAAAPVPTGLLRVALPGGLDEVAPPLARFAGAGVRPGEGARPQAPPAQ